MSSVCRLRLAALLGGAIAVLTLPATVQTAAPASPFALRVCADPNNLPFSNQREQGFENRIARLVGRELGRRVEYFWQPQRRGFVRSTIGAGRCEVIIGVAAALDTMRTTLPYYRSTYVFVSRTRDGAVRSFDDPRLKRWRIGIQITGDDYDNPPAAQALASRQLFNQVRGFTVYGDYSREVPQRDVIDAVADGRVDVAAVWGPLAGYFAAREPVALTVTPTASHDSLTDLPLTFAIAMGVERRNDSLAGQLNTVITRRQRDIDRILRAYHVPVVGPARPAEAGRDASRQALGR
jgi:mxaJ protein